MTEPQVAAQSISSLADRARNARRRAENSVGLPRLEAANEGLQAAKNIEEQNRGIRVRDQEGRRNLDELIAALTELRRKGVAETKIVVQKLLALVGKTDAPKDKRAAAKVGIEKIFSQFPLDFPEATDVRGQLAQITIG